MAKRVGSKGKPVVFVPEPWRWHYWGKLPGQTVQGWKWSRYDSEDDVIARELVPDGLEVLFIECEGVSPEYATALEEGRAVVWDNEAGCYTWQGQLWAFDQEANGLTVDELFRQAMGRLGDNAG